jgi:hypothetical protein
MYARQVLCMVQPFDDSPAAMGPIPISRKICCKRYTWSYGKASDHLMAGAVCEPGFIVLRTTSELRTWYAAAG